MKLAQLSELIQLIEAPVEKLEAPQLDEGAGSLARSIENWMDATKTYSFEGSRGIRNFTKLVSMLGYSSMDDFLEDNPGCLEAMVTWIGSQNSTDWKSKFAEHDKSEE